MKLLCSDLGMLHVLMQLLKCYGALCEQAS